MSGLKQPSGQKLLTNVSIVRYKKDSLRFEIACYRNTVLNYRAGMVTDLEDVLQAETLFSNAIKGDIARRQDVKHAFGDMDTTSILRLILQKGSLQEGEDERELRIDRLRKDVIQIVLEKCVHPESLRSLTTHTVELMIDQSHFCFKTDEPAKRQALRLITALCAQFPQNIERARMEIRVMPTPQSPANPDWTNIQEVAHSWEIREDFFCQIYPKDYPTLVTLCQAQHLRAEVARQVVSNQGIQEIGASLLSAAQPQTAPAAAPHVFGKCQVCGLHELQEASYREHCKSALHVLNHQRRVKELEPLSQAAYEASLFEADHNLLKNPTSSF